MKVQEKKDAIYKKGQVFHTDDLVQDGGGLALLPIDNLEPCDEKGGDLGNAFGDHHIVTKTTRIKYTIYF